MSRDILVETGHIQRVRVLSQEDAIEAYRQLFQNFGNDKLRAHTLPVDRNYTYFWGDLTRFDVKKAWPCSGADVEILLGALRELEMTGPLLILEDLQPELFVAEIDPSNLGPVIEDCWYPGDDFYIMDVDAKSLLVHTHEEFIFGGKAPPNGRTL